MRDGGFTVWDGISLAIASTGLLIALANSARDFARRRPKAVVLVEWGVAPLGSVRRHLFLIVRIVNVRERPVLVTRVEFAGGDLAEAQFRTFREQPQLPTTLGDHEEARVLYDVDRGVRFITELGMRSVHAVGASGTLAGARIPAWVIEEAEQIRSEADDE